MSGRDREEGGRKRESGGRVEEKGRERIGGCRPHRWTASLTRSMWQPSTIFITLQLPVISAISRLTRFSELSHQKFLRQSLVFLVEPSSVLTIAVGLSFEISVLQSKGGYVVQFHLPGFLRG